MTQNNFRLNLSEEADLTLQMLKSDKSKKSVEKAVLKALKFMAVNLKKGPNDEEIFESYAQNNTPGAYRIFWFYGPDKKEITIVAITPHP